MALFGRSRREAAPPAATSRTLRRLPDPPAADASGRRSVAQHREFVLRHAASQRPFGIGLLDAVGLTLCETIVADLDLPVASTAVADGWALRAADVGSAEAGRPVLLPVVAGVAADGRRLPLTPGTAVAMVAGEPVPEGADAVVAAADGEEVEEDVRLHEPPAPGANLRAAGSRVSEGTTVLRPGAVIGPRAVGLLAELGLDKVLARPRPRVVVLTVGADLVEPGLPLERVEQTYDATTALLAAAVRLDGGQPFAIGTVEPDAAVLRRTLSEQLLRADLVLIAGEVAELADVLSDLGAVDEAELALDPACPGLFGVIGDEDTPVLALSAEPVSAYLGYQLFGRPLLRRLAGAEADPEPREVPLLESVRCDPEVTTVLPARLGTDGVIPLAAGEQIGAVELADAEVLVVIEPGTERVEAGTAVACWALEP